MYDITGLEKSRNKALQKYESLKSNLQNAEDISSAAQNVNDAWLEFKKVDREYNTGIFMKKQGDLYGC